MTVHIGIANSATALLASDSQGSDDTSETHGFQKQFAGPDFLVGVAGLGLLLNELFHRLQQAISQPVNPLLGVGLNAFIEDFISQEVQPSARSQIQIITVTPPTPDGAVIRVFRPGVFVHFGLPSTFGTIGSGAPFVQRAASWYRRLGIRLALGGIADQVTAIEDFAKAADESLTVDDSFLLGVISQGRSYVMGDRRISLWYAPDLLKQQWAQATNRFHDLMAAARTINGEMVRVQQELSAVRTGSLTRAHLDAIQDSHDAVIAPTRQALADQLQDFFNWYDALLGRP